jgi:hypothetical protein
MSAWIARYRVGRGCHARQAQSRVPVAVAAFHAVQIDGSCNGISALGARTDGDATVLSAIALVCGHRDAAYADTGTKAVKE